ncbi:NADPH oxidase organizer 1a [Centropristis striata]|uniref:NADPH oxidase organizer 1a n=1 Tax=Centropristis striata TaxID=184440 RepID=UPI0027E1C7E9|nr:NADPH oxidase organizer 1a [Centropristis striata]
MEEQRYPISVRLTGVMHKEKNKMYMSSVLWSDQNDIVVYRTFQEFKEMHKELKKAFPAASKTKKSDRIIPKFIGKKANRGGQKKTPTKSLLRLKLLQKYCDELLSCDPRVSQSAELIKFFHPKAQDLQPEFSKNSIMIMPSEDEIRSSGEQVGNVTQPFVTETYRCVAPYETKDTKNKPFKVALDEKVDVLIKDKAGWWLVENEEKRMAWFPAPYLEKIDDFDDDEDDIDGASERGMLYIAVKSYKATKSDEISVVIGAMVEVLQKSDNGWWLIRYNGKAGYIPTMYLQPYNNPHLRMTSPHHNQDPRPSSPNRLPSLEQQSGLLQGNELKLPQSRSPSPRPRSPNRQQRSHSLDIMSEQAPPPQPAARTPSPAPSATTSPTAAMQSPPPVIRVEMDGDEDQQDRFQRADSEGSFISDSDDFSEELNSSWGSSSSFNMSQSDNEDQLRVSQSYASDQLRLSRTPPPMPRNRLSPTSATEGKLVPSVSDPNLYKGPASPKVPPRPRAQEILTRCTTITRKNAAKGAQTPTQTEIMSR